MHQSMIKKIYPIKRIIQYLLFFFLVFFLKLATATSVPTVQLKYAYLFDPVCSNKNAYLISSVWIDELNKKLPEWQSTWNDRGTLLLNTAIKIVGKSFPQEHYTIPISLCNFPSMSEPLMVNVRYSLYGFTKNPVNIDVTISTIEHEILHTYIDTFLPKNTLLLEKYRNESQTVLSHLHLFALQKAIYLSLNQDAILKDVITKDSILPNGEYKRAWEIVKKEGYIPFINELKVYQIKQ
jgi:hypothetical protein